MPRHCRYWGETDLELQIRAASLPAPVRQFKFHQSRRWKSDFAWPEHMVLMEVEGGIWSQGRHVRGIGYENDCHKYNEAAMMGYRVLRVTTGMVQKGEAIDLLMRVFPRRP